MFQCVPRYSDWLRARRSRDWIPVEARFSALVQTGPGTHPASCTMGNGSFPGVRRPGRDVDHPPRSSAEVKERVELYLYSPAGPSWPVLGWSLPCSSIDWQIKNVEKKFDFKFYTFNCFYSMAYFCLSSYKLWFEMVTNTLALEIILTRRSWPASCARPLPQSGEQQIWCGCRPVPWCYNLYR